MNHIKTDQTRPECIVYDYISQYQHGEKNNWGFSIPYNLLQELNDDNYFVNIKTEFNSGKMEIVDWVLPGETSDTIFFAAHTCHPEQVNDGIACIAVIVELFRWLQKKESRRYTYRAIFGPEYFAAAGFLQMAKNINSLKYGFFLDMLGNGKPIVFSHSFIGNSYVDLVIENVLKYDYNCEYFQWPYRGMWGNDEMFYDGPDFKIPTVCIGRDAFDTYHTDKDNLENCNFKQLEESLSVLKKIVDAIETDLLPKRLYKGPLYLSRYNLNSQKNASINRMLQKIQIMIDGELTCMEIATKLDIDFKLVKSFVNELLSKGLISKQVTKS